MSKWNTRSVADDARALAVTISKEGCWCLSCMAENASNGDGTDLIRWLGYDPKTVDCQGDWPDTVEVLVRIAEALRTK